MRVLITGGCGFIGHKLAQRLATTGRVTVAGRTPATIERLVATDVTEPPQRIPGVRYVLGDLGDTDVLADALGDGIDLVVHLAAVVSGAAERDFDLGMRVNLDATQRLLEQCRRMAAPTPPCLVFASSVAVFGAAPPVVHDDTPATPLTSYGTQKAMAELLINDMSRKGFLDGRSLRLPTIVVRPGKPNAAASSFASSILREPLQGQPTQCPVPRDTAVWVLSPRRVVDAFLHAAALPPDAWGNWRVLNLNGLNTDVGAMVTAMAKAGGDPALIDWTPDPFIQQIVATWPTRFEAARARTMGFPTDDGIDTIIAAFLEDDRRLPGAGT